MPGIVFANVALIRRFVRSAISHHVLYGHFLRGDFGAGFGGGKGAIAVSLEWWCSRLSQGSSIPQILSCHPIELPFAGHRLRRGVLSQHSWWKSHSGTTFSRSLRQHAPPTPIRLHQCCSYTIMRHLSHSGLLPFDYDLDTRNVSLVDSPETSEGFQGDRLGDFRGASGCTHSNQKAHEVDREHLEVPSESVPCLVESNGMLIPPYRCIPPLITQAFNEAHALHTGGINHEPYPMSSHNVLEKALSVLLEKARFLPRHRPKRYCPYHEICRKMLSDHNSKATGVHPFWPSTKYASV